MLIKIILFVDFVLVELEVELEVEVLIVWVAQQIPSITRILSFKIIHTLPIIMALAKI